MGQEQEFKIWGLSTVLLRNIVVGVILLLCSGWLTTYVKLNEQINTTNRQAENARQSVIEMSAEKSAIEQRCRAEKDTLNAQFNHFLQTQLDRVNLLLQRQNRTDHELQKVKNNDQDAG